MEFHFKKSQFIVKSQFKELKCADEGHSLNQDFTVIFWACDFKKWGCLAEDLQGGHHSKTPTLPTYVFIRNNN